MIYGLSGGEKGIRTHLVIHYNLGVYKLLFIQSTEFHTNKTLYFTLLVRTIKIAIFSRLTKSNL